MDRTFKLIIEYDGSAYHGWQRQPEKPTIQGEIEKILREMTQKKVTLIGSGRTDAGVHALGQVAHFCSDTLISPQALMSGLNSLLPDDIVIKSCEVAKKGFHARYDVSKKTYEYRILNNPSPSAILHRYVWFVRKPLNRSAMAEASRHLIGTHDFKAFEGAGSPRSHTIRQVEAATLQEENSLLVFRITANGFLRFMVRNIMGTLVDVGRKKLLPEDLKRILESKDRNAASATAPPQGLFLISVQY